MTPETRKLLARRHMGFGTLAEVVGWAVWALEAGFDTEYLRMLASRGDDPHWEDVENEFSQVMDELGWTMPEPETVLRLYARDIARKIVEDTVPPVEACRELYRVYRALEYPQDLQAWLYLDDDLEPGTYRELEGEELNEAIRREARMMLQT